VGFRPAGDRGAGLTDEGIDPASTIKDTLRSAKFWTTSGIATDAFRCGQPSAVASAVE